MRRIHFIVNPIAGKGNNSIDHTILADFFSESIYQVKICYTHYKGEAVILAQESINQGVSIIVACGGDGTINEVASALVGTNCILGIIPMGSGNGLASNLNIPKDLRQALSLIRNQATTKIDVGSCNGTYFFSNTGFGFDAKVIRNYESFKSRNLRNYIKACAAAFLKTNKEDSLVVTIDGTKKYKDPFLIFASNSNELGYNFSLTPKASLQDGLLDVLIIPKMNKLRMLWFGVLMLLKKHLTLKEVVSYQAQKIDLTRNKGACFESQLDGEYRVLSEMKVSIELLKASISIIN